MTTPTTIPNPAVTSNAQNVVDVNLNVLHTVGGESTFDRKKWMNVHSSNSEPDWNGEFDKLNYLINDLDVYFARDTGGLTSAVLNHTPEQMVSGGKNNRNWYGTLTDRHPFEKKQDLIVANQDRIFEKMSGAEAGKRTAAYMNNYFGSGGTDGMPSPQYVELMNEPLFPLHDFVPAGKRKASIDEIFDYHLDMANEIKANAPDVKIGGYVTAFPTFEKNNFNRWDERWKTFIDKMGDKMDFYSIHLYDFPGIGGGKQQFRKGANNEATLDMIEQYGKLTGKNKPFLISEYGSQLHDWYNQPWSAQRDWLSIKATNNMLLQFMERPDRIVKAVPFTPIKAEWGNGNFANNGVPYYWRMMRKANEPSSYTGDWEWTEYIKFYELWKDVNGSRVDSIPNNINIQADTYVKDNKAYIILNSLSTDVETINLNIKGVTNNPVQSVKIRHLFNNGNSAGLTISNHTFDLNSSLEIQPEATIIAEYIFKNNVIIDENSNETKYYADKYLQPISANNAISFAINGVSKSDNGVKSNSGEAVLRIGVGRDHNSSLTPVIRINGTQVDSPVEYRGDDQLDRDRFFGVLEVKVPYNLIQENNTVDITFPDNGGHISSLAMQVFNFSDDIRNEDNLTGGIAGDKFAFDTDSDALASASNAEIVNNSNNGSLYYNANIAAGFESGGLFASLVGLLIIKLFRKFATR